MSRRGRRRRAQDGQRSRERQRRSRFRGHDRTRRSFASRPDVALTVRSRRTLVRTRGNRRDGDRRDGDRRDGGRRSQRRPRCRWTCDDGRRGREVQLPRHDGCHTHGRGRRLHRGGSPRNGRRQQLRIDRFNLRRDRLRRRHGGHRHHCRRAAIDEVVHSRRIGDVRDVGGGHDTIGIDRAHVTVAGAVGRHIGLPRAEGNPADGVPSPPFPQGAFPQVALPQVALTGVASPGVASPGVASPIRADCYRNAEAQEADQSRRIDRGGAGALR